MHSRRRQQRDDASSPPSPSSSPSPSPPPLPRKCSLGCPVLDSLLGGGIPCGSVTEIVGECGAGKTQICLQLLVSAQAPPSHGGLGASSVYVFTESYFPSRRLQQIAKGFAIAGLGLNSSGKAATNPIGNGVDPCDNIFVQAIQTVEELWSYLEQLRALLVCTSSMPTKLLIIDSIAALFRSDFDNDAQDLARRMEWFFKISSRLKQYAHRYDIAILVTNQVVDHIENQEEARKECDSSVHSMLSGSYGALMTEGRRIVPALGIGWGHCVNTRLFISREQEMVIDATPSIVQRLESELPDDLLLSLAPGTSHEGDHNNDENQRSSAILPPSSDDFERHCRRSRVRRRLHVVFAPNLPAARSCEFVVESNRIRGIEAASFA